MSRLEIEAIVTGTRPMEAYDGVRLADSVVEDIARRLRTEKTPMLVSHDIRRPLDTEILDAQVRATSDGFKEVWVRFTVDEAQWREFEREVQEAGAPGGFSFSASEPVTVLEAAEGASDVVLELAADASHWPDGILLSAGADLQTIGRVEVSRRYEFAIEPIAVVMLGVIGTVALGVLSNAIYDALKRFLRPNRPTVFHFRVQQGDRSAEARLETSDAAALQEAVRALQELFDPPRELAEPPAALYVWDDQQARWVPL